jgi:3-methyladenine DNA glycosylase AlkC
MRHLSISLKSTLPENFEEAVNILIEISPFIKGFEAMTLPDFVEVYGMEHFDLSLKALAIFTKYSSSEFAIRPFLKKDPQKTMEFMSDLAKSKNENQRRFASEGCRPRLPWAMALPDFKKDPTLIFPILEKLKSDESEFVRKSAANNLNDISKDNPDLVLDVCENWYGLSKNTDWIVKHACRSLLKAGNSRALMIFGFEDAKNVIVRNLIFDKKTVQISEEIVFSFQLELQAEKYSKIRLEYGMDFMKANGKLSRKIFQISEKTYEQGTFSITKKHSFVNRTTRKHYLGKHRIAIIVNGEEKTVQDFELVSVN